jgi:hypothetical protein
MALPSLLRQMHVGPPESLFPLVKVIGLGRCAPQVSNQGHMVPPGGSPRANTIIDGDNDSNVQEGLNIMTKLFL